MSTGNSEKETGPTEFSKFVKTVYELAKMDGMGLIDTSMDPGEVGPSILMHTTCFLFCGEGYPLSIYIPLFHKYVF